MGVVVSDDFGTVVSDDFGVAVSDDFGVAVSDDVSDDVVTPDDSVPVAWYPTRFAEAVTAACAMSTFVDPPTEAFGKLEVSTSPAQTLDGVQVLSTVSTVS